MSQSRLAATVCLVTAVYWLALFVATHIPLPADVGQSSTSKSHSDKIQHVAAFAGLAMLLCATGAVLRRRAWLIPNVLALIVVYAAVDEVTQKFVPTRVADLHDGLADFL